MGWPRGDVASAEEAAPSVDRRPRGCLVADEAATGRGSGPAAADAATGRSPRPSPPRTAAAAGEGVADEAAEGRGSGRAGAATAAPRRARGRGTTAGCLASWTRPRLQKGEGAGTWERERDLQP